MALKIGRMIRIAAFMLCALMMMETAAAGFVWADEKTTEEHEPLNGWVDTDAGRAYYIDDVAQTGMQDIDGKRYYFNGKGIMQTGLVDISGATYLFDDKTGMMLTGWIKRNGKIFYHSKESGKRLYGSKKIDGHYYFFKVKSGAMLTGWRKVKKNKYYYDLKTGRRAKGKRVIKGATYYFRKNGKMVKGWLKVNGKKFYHNQKTGKRFFGKKKLGKYLYYFKPKSGKMQVGWLKLKGKKYYYDKKGHKLFGEQKIDGKMYYLDQKTGVKIPKGSYYLYEPIWNKTSRSKYLIYVDKKSKKLSVFKGKARHWDLVKRVSCAIGKRSTPTPSGTYHVTSKVGHFGHGYTVWHATGFIGTLYLIHSVLCYSGTKRVKDGRLGAAISHGCVRLRISDAKWIYEHVPHGSKVYIK